MSIVTYGFLVKSGIAVGGDGLRRAECEVMLQSFILSFP